MVSKRSPEKLLKVSADVAARARAPKPTNEIFRLPEFPEGVKPAADMAMDSGYAGLSQWAATQFYAAMVEGQTFLGYPVLAEMAQRPEYRRIVETIARHMTRKWIKFDVKGDDEKSEKIEIIQAAMKRLRVESRFREIAEHDGFFGRGHLYLDFGSDEPGEIEKDVGNGSNDTSRAKVGRRGLKGIRTVEAMWSYPSAFNASNPLAADWYKPQFWYVMGRKVHRSRLLTIVGREVPDMLKPAYAFGGLPLTQMAKPYVENWLRTRQSVSDIINAFSVFVLSTNMADALMSGDDGTAGGNFYNRLDLFNNLRDNRGVLAIDKDREAFQNVSAPLGTLDHLQAQSQEHICSVAAIPSIEYTGIQPTGLNASSDGELRTFYTAIKSAQEALFRDPLETVLGFIQLSEFGQVDPDITFEFVDLWEPTDKEKAETGAAVTTAVVGAFDSGVIDRPTALKELKQFSQASGMFSNISTDAIAEAEEEPPSPAETIGEIGGQSAFSDKAA